MRTCPSGHWRPQFAMGPCPHCFEEEDTQPDAKPFGVAYIQHEPGCFNHPRTPRGCHCGADHQ